MKDKRKTGVPDPEGEFMPYIKQETRLQYNEIIEQLSLKFECQGPSEFIDIDVQITKALQCLMKKSVDCTDDWKGELNYLISKLCHGIIKAKGLRYHVINDIIGIIDELIDSLGGLCCDSTPWKNVLKLFVSRITFELVQRRADMESLRGALRCSQFELYAMVARPYEDKKSLENGPVSELDNQPKAPLPPFYKRRNSDT